MGEKRSNACAGEELRRRLENNQALVGIIGLGYVGLPLAHAMHDGGLSVIGFDTDPHKITCLEHGRNYLSHLGSDMAVSLANSDRFFATSDMQKLERCDVIIVCVPTPLGKHREPDLSYVINSALAIGRTLRRGQLICLESTTYPGTTRNEFLPAILQSANDHKKKLSCGNDFFVAFSPEREDPGRRDHTTRSIPKLIGGVDKQSRSLAKLLYQKAVASIIEVESAEIAEAAKLLENIFRAVNIALVNEAKVILQAMDIDIWQVIRAASTKPFGFMPFYPGPGLGGHCIPIDPFYLTWKANEVGRPTKFIELAGEINTEMPGWVVEQVILSLNKRGIAVSQSTILVLGLAYKPNVNDSRESPSFELIFRLKELGARVDYSDPHIPTTPKVRKYDLQMASVEITKRAIAQYDCVLIATNHDLFEWSLLAENAKLIVDTRDAMRSYEGILGDRLVRA